MYDFSHTSLGLWVDLPKRMVLTQEFFSWFQEVLRFDFMALMIDEFDEAVNFSWSPKDVEKALKLAEGRSIGIGVTTCPHPVKSHLRQQERLIREIMSVGPVAEWETDQEHNWTPDSVEGFKGMSKGYTTCDGVHILRRKSPYDMAGDYLVNIKEEVCSDFDARSTITTFTYHIENSKNADTTGSMDRVVVQAYAVDSRFGKPIHFDHRLGPGRIQPLTLDRTISIPEVRAGLVEIGAGHAAWNQDNFKRKVEHGWVTESPLVAMQTSLDASMRYPIVDHRWWSAKFVYPKSRRYNQYAEEFLKGLRTVH